MNAKSRSPRKDKRVKLAQLVETARPGKKIRFSERVLGRLDRNRQTLVDLVTNGHTIYGVNTGVGGFVHWLIPNDRLHQLQENIIRAVATNVGEYFSEEDTRATMLARIYSLARGNSGISRDNFEKLVAIFNAGIIPCIPEKGSLGASGDLGPLAHIAEVGIGKGKAKYRGEIVTGSEALRKAGINPMRLSYKEGLALINGTSAMVGVGGRLVYETKKLVELYEAVSALSFETLHSTRKSLDPRVHELKPHKGQRISADRIFNLLEGSHMVHNEDAISSLLAQERRNIPVAADSQIEDAYSLRCTPQIVGPVRDIVGFVSHTVENELNSSNDNPLVITEEKDVFHNGHFHGQYMAMAMDQLSLGLTTLSNLSDRRIDRFLKPSTNNGLPPFLSTNPGLELGLMGGQFMATSLTAENRSLCIPLSVQTLPSTGDFQDIVSMGLIGARRARQIFENLKYIISFELMCACQAADFRGIEKLAPKTKNLFDAVRTIIPFYDHDQSMTDHLEELHTQLLSLSDTLRK